MGGRGASFHANANEFGRPMNTNGFYMPSNTRLAEQWHFSKGTFDQNKWDALTDEQRAAIRNYTGSYYTPINDALFGNAPATDRIRKMINDATEGMRKMSATENFVVWRGDKPRDIASLLGGTLEQISDPKFLAGRIGKTVEFKGFMSTAITEEHAWTFKGVTDVIKIPAGTAGFYVDPVSVNSGEKEFLLAPGTKMVVKQIKRGPNGRLNYIELEVVKRK